MDYVVPQIYWNMGHKVADYTELVLWWSRHIKNAQLIVGQHVRRTMDSDQLHPKMVLSPLSRPPVTRSGPAMISGETPTRG